MIRRRLSGSKAVVDQLPRHQEEGGGVTSMMMIVMMMMVMAMVMVVMMVMLMLIVRHPSPLEEPKKRFFGKVFPNISGWGG